MASSSCRSVALFLRRARILRSALTSNPVALASRYLSRMSPASAFFSSSSRSICSTNWRSCFCAETCSVVMDLTYPQQRNCRRTRRDGVSLPTPDDRATLAAPHPPFKLLRQAIQSFWSRDFRHGSPSLHGWRGAGNFAMVSPQFFPRRQGGEGNED